MPNKNYIQKVEAAPPLPPPPKLKPKLEEAAPSVFPDAAEVPKAPKLSCKHAFRPREFELVVNLKVSCVLSESERD